MHNQLLLWFTLILKFAPLFYYLLLFQQALVTAQCLSLFLPQCHKSSYCRYEERTARDGSFHTSTLRVVNVSATLDYAVFSCTARNSLGEDKLDIQLVSTSIASAYISILSAIGRASLGDCGFSSILTWCLAKVRGKKKRRKKLAVPHFGHVKREKGYQINSSVLNLYRTTCFELFIFKCKAVSLFHKHSLHFNYLANTSHMSEPPCSCKHTIPYC